MVQVINKLKNFMKLKNPRSPKTILSGKLNYDSLANGVPAKHAGRVLQSIITRFQVSITDFEFRTTIGRMLGELV